MTDLKIEEVIVEDSRTYTITENKDTEIPGLGVVPVPTVLYSNVPRDWARKMKEGYEERIAELQLLANDMDEIQRKINSEFPEGGDEG